MRKLVWAVGVLVVLLLVLAVAAPLLIPVERYRGLMEAQVQKATGRAFRIAGPMKLAVLPRLKMELNDVRFGNAPGGLAPEMATIRRLDIGVGLAPLLHRRIEADRLVLIGPRIFLEVDRNGKPNWQFAKAAAEPRAAPAGGGSKMTFRFSGLSVKDGKLSYTDRRANTQQVLDRLDVTVDASDLESPLKVKGGVTYRDQRVDLDLHADKLAALMGAATTPMRVKLSAGPAKLDFDGSYTGGPALRADGLLKVDIGAVGTLVGWVQPNRAGRPIPIESVSLRAQTAADAKRVSLKNLVLKTDTMEVRGALSAEWAGPRPKVTGTLSTGVVDLSHYLSTEKDRTEKPAAPADQGWSDKPIDFSPLGLVNADLHVQAAGIKGRGFATGPTSIALALQDGRLDATVPNTTLFGGTAEARVHLAGGAAPGFSLETRVHEVQAEPLLTTFADFNRLQGTMNGTVDLRGQGASQRAIVSSLNGTVATTFLNGAIKGINIASVLRKARTAYLDSGAGAAEKTDFAELSSTFVVRNGTAHTDDLKMLAPLVRLKGEGDVVIPERRLAMRLEPTFVGTLQGQGGAGALGGVAVPLLVSGPWTHPSFTPDLKGIATEAVKDRLLGGAGGGLKGALGGLKPKGGGSNEGGKGALGGLRSLFGR